MSNTGSKHLSLTSQSAWILGAKVAGFAMNTMLPLLIVRYLSLANVGVYRQSFLVASNAVLVLPLGFSMSAYYFLNREPEKHGSVVLNILVFNFIMGAAAFVPLFFFPGILGFAFQNAEMTRLAPLIGLLVWLWIFSGFLETAALALQHARTAAVFIVLFQFFKTLFMIGAVLSFRTVDSLLYAALVLFAVQSVVLVVYLHKLFPRFWARIDLPFFRRQFAYALPFGLSVLLYVGQTDIHNYFVSHSFSAAEFAIYSVGCFQLPLIAMLYESVGAVMIPKMSQLQAEDRKREMLELAVNATQKLAFFYFPLFGFLMIVAGEFMTTLFTKEYAASASIFRVNLLALPLFSLVVDPLTRAFPAAGRFLLKVRILICLALVGIFWLGYGSFGLQGMISVVVAAILFEKLVCAAISVRILDARAEDIRLLIPIFKIAIAAAAGAAGPLIVYLLAADWLTAACRELGQVILSYVGFTKGIDFTAGALFLSVCLAIYLVGYLAAAYLLRAIEPGVKEKIQSMGRRIWPTRAIETKAA